VTIGNSRASHVDTPRIVGTLLGAGLIAPRYGTAALSDVMPSVLTALGVAGEANVLELAPQRRVCVLLVDGLGWELLRIHRDEAPVLNDLADRAGRVFTAGFPTTTTSSLTSLGVGVPAGQHGMTGYQVRVPGTRRLLNALQWDARIDPREWQPCRTALQRAEAAGVTVTSVAPVKFKGSGLTEASLRGGRYVGVDDPSERARAAGLAMIGDGSTVGGPTLTYVYYGAVDRTGHVHGCKSPEWRASLVAADAFTGELMASMPPDALLVVTADHGMVDIDAAQIVDVADNPALQVGVEMLAGEGRSRYVHVRPGAIDDALSIWREELENGFCVLTRAEAIGAGLLGPIVSPAAADRVGDLVVLAQGSGAVFDRRVDSRTVMALIGQHGSLTAAELLVPLLLHQSPPA